MLYSPRTPLLFSAPSTLDSSLFWSLMHTSNRDVVPGRSKAGCA